MKRLAFLFEALWWTLLLGGCATLGKAAASPAGLAVGNALQAGVGALPEPWRTIGLTGLALLTGIILKRYHQHLLETPPPKAPGA